MVKFAGFALLSALAVLLLREAKGGALGTVAVGCIGLLLAKEVFFRVGELFSQLSPLFLRFSDFLPLFGKILAVSWVGQVTSDVCRDLGASTVSSYVETVSRLEILLFTLPLIQKAVETALSFLP